MQLSHKIMTSVASFVDVNGVPTQVLTVGLDVNQKPPENVKKIILIIPGIVGFVSFLEEFAELLYSSLNNEIPVWAVGYPGHSPPMKGIHYPSFTDHPELYHPQNTALHIKSFIRHYVPDQCELILVGQSIGCKFIMDILAEPDPTLPPIIRSYLLFPAVQRLSETLCGMLMWILLNYFMWIPLIIMTFLSILPLTIQCALIYIIYQSVHPGVVKGLLQLANYRTARTYLSFARELLDTVKAFDTIEHEEKGNKVVFYVGVGDVWSPVSFWEELRLKLNEDSCLKIVYCGSGIKHVFQLWRQTWLMVNELSGMIKEDSGESAKPCGYYDMNHNKVGETCE